MNREEQSIVHAYETGKIAELAAEKARRNERNFTFNWTVEQHTEALNKKATELIAADSAKNQPAARPNSNKTYNTGLGYYGTAKDAARGFDGIE